MLAALGFLLAILANPSPAVAEQQDLWGPPSFTTGDTLRDLAIEDMEGNHIRLSSYRGKVLLLNFWVSWCGECDEQAPLLLEIFEKYHPRGLDIVGITYDKDRAQADAFRRKHAIPWPIEFTGKGFWKNRMGRAFHVDDTGAILLIDTKGILEGDFRDLSRLQHRLDQLLKPQRNK